MPPAGAKAEQALRKQKDAKQKKILLALLPVLLLLLVWQGPGTVRALTGGDAPPPAPAPTPTTAAPAPVDPTAPPSTAAGGAPVTDPAAPATLPESDVAAAPGAGQLISFDRFVGKDPFRQQVIERKIAEDDLASVPDATTPTPDDTSSGGGTAPDDTAAPTAAHIDTNGAREWVSLDGTFPADDPIFRLVFVTATRAEIGLVTGSFSDGRETVEVAVGDSITLVSEPDGMRYTITIVSVA